MLKWLAANRLGTHLFTMRKGEEVGRDEFGNVYYRERGKNTAGGPFTVRNWRDERRWVVYAAEGEIEATFVPPVWNAWLHHNRDRPPSEDPPVEKYWEKEHAPNFSGTPLAYVPAGHEKRGGHRAPATGDYEAWDPGED